MPSENPFAKAPNIESLDELGKVIASLEKKSGCEVLVFLLMSLSRNESKKRSLSYEFNLRSINWNNFLYLEDTQITEMTDLLTDFLGETEKDKEKQKAEGITEKLDF